ncbi:MAG: hypothetical protein QXP52_00955 [Candidatus Aenigmatarchaeota archaeon]
MVKKSKAISEALAMLLMIVLVVTLMGVVGVLVMGTIGKQGSFTIVDAICNTTQMKIVAHYGGTDASNADIVIRYRDRVNATATLLLGTDSNVTIYVGDLCDRSTIGAPQCNSQVSSANPVKSGQVVGIRITGASLTADREYEVKLSVFGRPGAPTIVRCVNTAI